MRLPTLTGALTIVTVTACSRPLTRVALVLALGCSTAACEAASDDASGQNGEEQAAATASTSARTTADTTADAYDSSVCGQIDVAPYTDILGVTVPPLTVTTDSPGLFRCRARTEELLVTLQFRANADHWDRIPEDHGSALDLQPLEAYPPHETTGNLMVVRLERPWSVAVLAATQERPEATDAQLEAILRDLDALGN